MLFLNKKNSDAKLIREIKHIFRKDSIIIYGDDGLFNDTCKKGNIFFQNKRIKNLLKENFKMYNIDEFKTNKIHYKSKVECENLYI
jgi:thioredoxin-related protein